MRLIDAQDLFGELCEYLEEDEDTERGWIDIEVIVQVLNHAPTVDAVPVIRCKDCIKKELCSIFRDARQEVGFCAWAEREEE